MNFAEVELPTNKKFGFFFTVVFLFCSGYFYHLDNDLFFSAFALLGIFVLILTLVDAEMLLPMNRLWMRIGLILGIIVSPVVMGFIFFALLLPLALVTRFVGRDELGLKFKTSRTYWIKRDTQVTSKSFKNQF